MIALGLSIQGIWTNDLLFSLGSDDWPCYTFVFSRSKMFSPLKLHFCSEAKKRGIACFALCKDTTMLMELSPFSTRFPSFS
jgi:hypothetical protein